MAVRTKVGFLAAALTLGAMALPVFAQDQTGNGGNQPADAGGAGNGGGRQGRRGQGGGPSGGGPGGGGNPQQWRQQRMDQLKQDLGVTDDEMAALQPKIDQVMQLSRDANPRMGFGGRGRGGPGGGGPGGGNGPTSNVQKAMEELQATLQNKDAKPEEIKGKLEAVRTAKTKAKEDLVKAQADLKGLLTQRQEAVLVEQGMLE